VFGIKTEPLTREWIDGVVQIARRQRVRFAKAIAPMPAS
jgi:hypothetical protein